MEHILSENLFLIELVVDKCIILPCAIPKEVQNTVGEETCISIQFLDNEPLNVCEEDFERKSKFVEDENIKSGKSCLFAMSPDQAEECLDEFNIYMSICKKLTNNMLPDKTKIGAAIIPAVSIFTDIIDILKANSENDINETITRTLKDNFNVFNSSDEVIGSISVFLRFSCFGKLIVTQFQMNLENKFVFFKDKEGKSLYKYRRASRNEMEEGAGDKPAGNYPCAQYGSPTSNNMNVGAGESSCLCFSSARPNSPVTPVSNPGQRLYKNQALTMSGAGASNRFGLNICPCRGAAPDQNITVVPPVSASAQEAPTENTDPCLDVFILKINKKSEKRDKKSKLQVELISPRVDNPGLPPKLFTQETQYEGGAGSTNGKGGAGGGKGGKGGKGGGKGGKGGKKGKNKDGSNGSDGSEGDDNENLRTGKYTKNDKIETIKLNKDKANKDKITLPAFMGGILLKDRKYTTDSLCVCNEWLEPMCQTKQNNQSCCCESQIQRKNWQVPSCTSLYCSLGKIRSAVS